VYRVVGNLEKERFVGMARDKTNGATRDFVGEVTRGLDRRRVLEKVRWAGPDSTDLSPVGVVGMSATQESVELVESVGDRAEFGFPTQVPLADERRRIPVRLEQRR
jgi:hypothetical protein